MKVAVMAGRWRTSGLGRPVEAADGPALDTGLRVRRKRPAPASAGSLRRHRGVQIKDTAVVAEEVAAPVLGLPPGAGVTVRTGPCSDRVCGKEPACIPLSNNTHKCICPHDESPPTWPGMRCPNRNTVPLESYPIHINIIPPVSEGPSGSAAPAPAPAAGQPPPALDAFPATVRPPIKAQPDWVLLGWGGFALFGAAFLLTAMVVAVFRKRALRARKHKAPRSLSKGPLGSELFLTNPQYALSQGQAGTGPGAQGQGAALAHMQGQGAHPVEILSSAALSLQENIGEGCFGRVYRGELVGSDGELQTVAVKVLKESATREAEADFMREVDVMSSFQHPHILRLIGVLLREHNTAPAMVFEFMPFGDLTEVLRSSNRNPKSSPRPGLPVLSPEALLGVAMQVAKGMCYLAEQHFVHRDLACRNCLVGYNLTVKIADFGMSRDVYTCDYYKMGGSRALPVRWMSPEAILYGRFTLESDVWSFGVVLWEVLTRGKLPYYGHSNEEALKLILQGVLLQPPDSPDCPAAAVDLMRACWRTEPRDRLRFPEVSARLKAMRARSPGPGYGHGTLPRPPAFAAYPSLPDHLPALDLPELSEDMAVDLGEPEELLDPDNYLLPRPPDPSRCQYMQPIAD